MLGGIAATGTSEAARVAAAIVLLDRGWGKPPHTGKDSEGSITVEIVHRPRCLDRDEPKLVVVDQPAIGSSNGSS
jgi:hypothetical protein